MSTYIAGPVLRNTASQPRWVRECYQMIDDVINLSPRHRGTLPFAEPLLERMSAESFAGELGRRITAADAIIAVFLPDDQSTPVECALAAAAGKRVLILHEASTRVPRLLAGLPRVTTAIYGQNTSGAVARFLLG